MAGIHIFILFLSCNLTIIHYIIPISISRLNQIHRDIFSQSEINAV